MRGWKKCYPYTETRYGHNKSNLGDDQRKCVDKSVKTYKSWSLPDPQAKVNKIVKVTSFSWFRNLLWCTLNYTLSTLKPEFLLSCWVLLGNQAGIKLQASFLWQFVHPRRCQLSWLAFPRTYENWTVHILCGLSLWSYNSTIVSTPCFFHLEHSQKIESIWQQASMRLLWLLCI